MFKLKVGKFTVPAVFVKGFEGHIEVMVFPARAGIHVNGVRRYFPFPAGGNNQLNGRLPFGPGPDLFHHKTPYVQGVGHGFGKTFIEIYLYAALIIMNSGKNKPFFDRGIFLDYGIKFPVGDFNANS
jgi:hypothetical protein